MKTKLLRRLRQQGRNSIEVLSVKIRDGVTIGMSYSYTGNKYRGLFSFGDTEAEVREKACAIWLRSNIRDIRRRFAKKSRKYNQK